MRYLSILWCVSYLTALQATIEEATQIHQQYPDQDDSESETDQPVAGGVDDHDDDEFDAEKMMAKAQNQAQNVKVQEQKQEQQVAKKKAVRAMEILRTLSWEISATRLENLSVLDLSSASKS
jgi:hypothetical protein